MVYDDDVLRGEDGSNRGGKIRIRHYDRILDLSASVFVARGDRNCSKEKEEEEDVLEGVRLRFESLPKELRALRLLEMVVWGKMVVIGGVRKYIVRMRGDCCRSLLYIGGEPSLHLGV